MKNKFLMFLFLMSVQALFVNCAKKSDNTPAPAGGAYCQAGSVYVGQSCLPQYNCPANHGYSNGQCLPGTSTPAGASGYCQVGQVSTAQYGCLPQNSCPANYGFYNGQCIPGTVTNTGGGAGGYCQAGSVNTVMGCLPQNTCPTGYGYWYGAYQGVTQGWCYQQVY